MTPVEVFERLGFSPIMQAIAGLAWMAVVLTIMMRAENARKKVNGNGGHVPPSAIPIPDHLAKIAEAVSLAMEIQRQNRDKLGDLKIQLSTIGESLKGMAAVREKQIEELILAVKDAAHMLAATKRWW